jgi:hypothetical protein
MYAEYGYIDEKELEGKIFSKVFKSYIGYDEKECIVFQLKDSNSGYVEYHDQDCCEDVSIEDICGDLSDLENTEILSAYCDYKHKCSEDDSDDGYEPNGQSQTWYFYNIRTIKGSVTIRWYGTSNGYYSETANLYVCKEI